jgi:hypothetical protein
MEQFERALREAAIRLTGRLPDQLSEEQLDLVMNDLGTSYFPQLSDKVSEGLSAVLAGLAFGGDAAALEAAERDVLANLNTAPPNAYIGFPNRDTGAAR